MSYTGDMHSRACWPAWYSSSTFCSAIHSDRYSSTRSAFSRRSASVAKISIVAHSGVAHQLDQRLPLGLFHADELDQAVPALVDAPGHHRLHADPGGVGALEGRPRPAPSRSSWPRRRRPRSRRGRPRPVRSARSKAARAAAAATVAVWKVAWWPNALSGGRSMRGRGAGREEPPAAAVDDGELLGGVVGVGAGHPERRDRADDQPRRAAPPARRRSRPRAAAAAGPRSWSRMSAVAASSASPVVIERLLALIQRWTWWGRPRTRSVPRRLGPRAAPAARPRRLLQAHDVGPQVAEQLGHPGRPEAAGHLEHPDALQARSAAVRTQVAHGAPTPGCSARRLSSARSALRLTRSPQPLDRRRRGAGLVASRCWRRAWAASSTSLWRHSAAR